MSYYIYMADELRFIADAMLGRLARWLRLLGFDTLYQKDISDADLLKLAKQQGRTVLTRDTHFRRFRNFRDYLLIDSDDTMEQLRQIIEAYNINMFMRKRCTRCNGVLEELADREALKGLVPEHIYMKHNVFQKCPDCGNVYWEGSHMKRFREKVVAVLKR